MVMRQCVRAGMRMELSSHFHFVIYFVGRLSRVSILTFLRHIVTLMIFRSHSVDEFRCLCDQQRNRNEKLIIIIQIRISVRSVSVRSFLVSFFAIQNISFLVHVIVLCHLKVKRREEWRTILERERRSRRERKNRRISEHALWIEHIWNVGSVHWIESARKLRVSCTMAS